MKRLISALLAPVATFRNVVGDAFRSLCIKASMPFMLAVLAGPASADDLNDMIDSGNDLATNIKVLIGSIAELVGGYILVTLLWKMWKGEREGGDEGGTTVKKLIAGVCLVAFPEFIGVGVSSFFDSGDGSSFAQ